MTPRSLLRSVSWRLAAARDACGFAVHRASGGTRCHRSAHALSQLVPVPREAASILGMTTARERRWVHWYGRALFRGEGDVVDLGSWFGSSTVPLVAGLAANRGRAAASRRVFAYDLFRWDEWMRPALAGTRYEGRFAPGESFLGAFEELTAPWRDRIVVRPGDLTATRWDGGPIEMLFVDAMKSWPLANAILAGFFPHVLPRRGIVAHQDFAHWGTPWIHLVMRRLRPWYEPVFHVPESGTLVWRCVAAPPADLLARGFSYQDFDDAEVDAAFAESSRLVGPEKRHGVAAAHAMAALGRGDPARARALLDDALARGMPPEGDLAFARAAVEEA